MAHDWQVESERELPEALQERKNESPKPTGKQKKSLEVLADWWVLYGQICKDDPTELSAVVYREMLQDVPAKILHDACREALKELGMGETPQFPPRRPTPERIHAIAQIMIEKATPGNRPKYLDEPKLTESEREAALAEPGYQELRRRILP